MFIATIIVVAILTALIFTLTIVAFSQIIKNEKREIELGNRDCEIKKDIEKEKKKSSKALNWISSIVGGAIALALLLMSVTAVTYRASGEQFAINDTVSLVIVTDSMDGFYNDRYKADLLELSDRSESEMVEGQFKAGDLLTFEKVKDDDELNLFEVYGYRLDSGKIITHRLIGAEGDKLVFRGDNTGGRDSFVDRSQVILHYNNFKITYVGFFVLFSQSGFGLYSFISVIVVYVLAEIFASKYDKLVKSRLTAINAEDKPKEADIDVGNQADKPIEDEPKGRLVEFTTKQGKHVKFYVKPKEVTEDEEQID